MVPILTMTPIALGVKDSQVSPVPLLPICNRFCDSINAGLIIINYRTVTLLLQYYIDTVSYVRQVFTAGSLLSVSQTQCDNVNSEHIFNNDKTEPTSSLYIYVQRNVLPAKLAHNWSTRDRYGEQNTNMNKIYEAFLILYIYTRFIL